MTETSSFTKGDGYWVKGNADCTITLAEPTATTDTNTTTITHNGISYNTITSVQTGRVWLDRNLGASQACTALDDTACYGDYFQWGRAADGHEKTTSATTSTQATTIVAADSSFITNSNWSTADSDGALRAAEWAKTDGTSICPVGYRVPTIADWELEEVAFESNTEAYDTLKLPSAGARSSNDGSMYSQGSGGYLWSSGVSSAGSGYLGFSSTNTLTRTSTTVLLASQFVASRIKAKRT